MLQFHASRLLGADFAFHGMAIPMEVGLKLLYRDARTPAEFLEDDATAVLIPWKNVAGLEEQKGWMGTKVVISVHDVRGLEPVPMLHDRHITLEIHRSNRDTLKPFLNRVANLRAGIMASDPEQVIDDVRDMLDGLHGEMDDFSP